MKRRRPRRQREIRRLRRAIARAMWELSDERLQRLAAHVQEELAAERRQFGEGASAIAGAQWSLRRAS